MLVLVRQNQQLIILPVVKLTSLFGFSYVADHVCTIAYFEIRNIFILFPKIQFFHMLYDEKSTEVKI